MTYHAQVQSSLLESRTQPVSVAPDLGVDDLSSDAFASMETYIRRAMIADAAGSMDYDETQSSLEHMLQRGGTALALRFPAQKVQYAYHDIVGRIGADVLAPKKPNTLAIIGAGETAQAHIEAALAYRRFAAVRVYARQPVAAAQMAKKYKHAPGGGVEVAGSPEAALHKADVVILATGATRPHIDPDWIMSGAHITCAFPQTVSAHELPIEMISRSKVIASDRPQHIGATHDHLVSASWTKRRVIHLGAMIDRFDSDRARGTTILFVSGADDMPGLVLKSFAHAEAGK